MRKKLIGAYCKGACMAAALLSVAALAKAQEAAPVFPPLSAITLKGGVFPIQGNLRKVAIGLNKDQTRDLLGVPHFDEGFWRVRAWNYLFKFRKGNDIVSCQYQVQFDDDMLVAGAYWKEQECANFVASN
ncbi:outer membrane protein assembly factor BamE [Herbaspirillum sp. SJZ099]|uniref:outer membrane protein assembly factor BamE n=1 Tax=Herbaspirillum sp. SJZ099 TaxID=2572916 RepID=UPI0011A033BD|nr:outer membrane protein assembly factor BamE [Herbaspirillum sp. SJZ099]TWC71725.1 outer membrane protein assembly factor BamE (lipoprotein component of BamABCDE complex) [Herbaspirillum sp. SJZ099]